jgi:hypothetical protein
LAHAHKPTKQLLCQENKSARDERPTRLVAQRRWNSRSLSSGVLGSCVLLGFSPFLVGLKSAFSLQISLGSPASGDEAFSRRWQSNGAPALTRARALRRFSALSGDIRALRLDFDQSASRPQSLARRAADGGAPNWRRKARDREAIAEKPLRSATSAIGRLVSSTRRLAALRRSATK